MPLRDLVILGLRVSRYDFNRLAEFIRAFGVLVESPLHDGRRRPVAAQCRGAYQRLNYTPDA